MRNYVHGVALKCCEICLPTHLHQAGRQAGGQAGSTSEARRSLGALHLAEVRAAVCVGWLRPSRQCWGAGEDGRGLAVSGSRPACLCSGGRWKKRHPAALGPPKVSPHRPNQSAGAPSRPSPPDCLSRYLRDHRGLAACYRAYQGGHLPLMPSWRF